MAPLPVSVPLGIVVSSCRSIQISTLDVPIPFPCWRHRHVSLLKVRGGSFDATGTDVTADSIIHSFEEDLANIRLQMVAEAEEDWERWRIEMLERRRQRELARRQSRAAADISAYNRTYASIVQSQEVKDNEDNQEAVVLETTGEDAASSALPEDGSTESEDDDNDDSDSGDATTSEDESSDEPESAMVTDDEVSGGVSTDEKEEEDGEEESEHFEEEDGDPSSDDVQNDDKGIDFVGDYDAPTDTDDNLIGDIGGDENPQETFESVEEKERKKQSSGRKQKKKRRKRKRRKRRGSQSVAADESESSDDETMLFSSISVAESGHADHATTSSVSKKSAGSLGSASVSFARKVLYYTGFVFFLLLFKIVCDALVEWALM